MLKSFLQQSIIYGLGQIAIQLVGFLIYPILTNDQYFTVAQFGIWNILAPSMTVLTVIYSGGLSTGFFKFYIGNNNAQQHYSAFVRSIQIVLSLGVVVTTVILPLLIFCVSDLFDQAIRWEYFLPVMITALSNSIIAVCLAVYRAQDKARKFVFVNSARFILMTLLIVLGVIILDGGLWGVLTAYATSSLLIGSILLIKTWISFEKTEVLPGLAKNIVKYSFPLMPTQLAGWVLSVSDKFVIGLVLGTTEVGLYSAGYQIALVTNAFFIGPFSLAWGPFMFREGLKETGPKKIADLFELYTMLGAMFVTPLILFGAEFVSLLSNNIAFQESYRVIPPVAIGYLFFGYYLFYTTGFNLYNRTKYFPLITGFVGVVNITLNLFLLPRWGYMAAAWVTLISYFTLFALMKIVTSKLYSLPVSWRKVIPIWVLLFCVIYSGNYLSMETEFPFKIESKALLLLAGWVGFLRLNKIKISDVVSETIKWFKTHV